MSPFPVFGTTSTRSKVSAQAHAAVASSFYPQRTGEAVDWLAPLFDSDGYPHALVALGGLQFVTQQNAFYVVWDRAKLTAVYEVTNSMGERLTIGNAPMSEMELERRRMTGAALLEQLREASDPALSAQDALSQEISRPRG